MTHCQSQTSHSHSTHSTSTNRVSIPLQTGGLYEGPALPSAIWRYECIWLPCIYRCEKLGMPQPVPPLDVAYIWHVHRLNPASYHAYCTATYGMGLEPHHPFLFTGTGCGTGCGTALLIVLHSVTWEAGGTIYGYSLITTWGCRGTAQLTGGHC
jgi:hypothetical protein